MWATRYVVPRQFLRFDRRELDGCSLVVRATPVEVRRARRDSDAVPLGYLYQVFSEYDPDQDLVMAAGHYDQATKVWVFSGDLTGIIGLTEPFPAEDRKPDQE